MRLLAFLSVFSLSLSATAQQVVVPQLSPLAAYDQATRPVEIVHRSVSNWSDVEQQALAVAVANAKDACAARKPADYAGDQLIAMARLCSLGLNFKSMGEAATLYIENPPENAETGKPQLSLAYGLKLEAALHQHDEARIMATAQAMLSAVPYDTIVDSAFNEALAYQQLAFMNDALLLYGVREPFLLAQLKADHPTLPLHLLYADGTAFAAHMQLLRLAPLAPAQEIALLDAALPATLSADDALPIAETRRRYALLGQPLPAITPTLSLFDPHETPRIDPAYGTATAFLLFPDWCAQCIRLAPELRPAMTRLGIDSMHLYVLLATSAPDKAQLLQPFDALTGATNAALRAHGAHATQPTTQEPARTKSPAELLLRTPSVTVPPALLTAFAATDYPFLVVVDHEGVVRFAQPAPESLLNQDDLVDRVTSHVAEQWPPAKKLE